MHIMTKLTVELLPRYDMKREQMEVRNYKAQHDNDVLDMEVGKSKFTRKHYISGPLSANAYKAGDQQKYTSCVHNKALLPTAPDTWGVPANHLPDEWRRVGLFFRCDGRTPQELHEAGGLWSKKIAEYPKTNFTEQTLIAHITQNSGTFVSFSRSPYRSKGGFARPSNDGYKYIYVAAVMGNGYSTMNVYSESAAGAFAKENEVAVLGGVPFSHIVGFARFKDTGVTFNSSGKSQGKAIREIFIEDHWFAAMDMYEQRSVFAFLTGTIPQSNSKDRFGNILKPEDLRYHPNLQLLTPLTEAISWSEKIGTEDSYLQKLQQTHLTKSTTKPGTAVSYKVTPDMAQSLYVQVAQDKGKDALKLYKDNKIEKNVKFTAALKILEIEYDKVQENGYFGFFVTTTLDQIHKLEMWHQSHTPTIKLDSNAIQLLQIQYQASTPLDAINKIIAIHNNEKLPIEIKSLEEQKDGSVIITVSRPKYDNEYHDSYNENAHKDELNHFIQTALHSFTSVYSEPSAPTATVDPFANASAPFATIPATQPQPDMVPEPTPAPFEHPKYVPATKPKTAWNFMDDAILPSPQPAQQLEQSSQAKRAKRDLFICLFILECKSRPRSNIKHNRDYQQVLNGVDLKFDDISKAARTAEFTAAKVRWESCLNGSGLNFEEQQTQQGLNQLASKFKLSINPKTPFHKFGNFAIDNFGKLCRELDTYTNPNKQPIVDLQ